MLIVVTANTVCTVSIGLQYYRMLISIEYFSCQKMRVLACISALNIIALIPVDTLRCTEEVLANVATTIVVY